MKLITADSKKLKKKMLGFYRDQYRKDPLRRDSMSALLKGLIDGTSIMTKSAFLEPVIVVEGKSILMIALLAHADRMPEIFQIAFLESSGYQPDAFRLILTRAERLALERGAVQISGSLNLHVNYGLGFLADSYDKIQSFGMAHSPEYIHEYFLEAGFEPVELLSYKKDMRGLVQLMADGLRQKVSQRYHVRELDLTNLESEARLYKIGRAHV